MLYAGAARVLETGDKRMEGKGACKGRGIPSPPLLRRPCFIHVPLMAFPEEVRCGIPHPHPSVLSIGDARALIDRRTVVNVITRERKIPYVVNVNGPSLTATWIKGNGKSVPSELPLRASDFSRLRPGPQGLVIPRKIDKPGQVNSFGHCGQAAGSKD